MKVTVSATWHMRVGTERRKLKPIMQICMNYQDVHGLKPKEEPQVLTEIHN